MGQKGGRKIFISAGEPSGDLLGSLLMGALKAQDPNVTLFGVGGERMEAEGIRSLFPMEELSLMGIFEVLPHIFSLKRRMNQVIEAILREKPDVVVTIDSSGFHFPLVKKLRKYFGKSVRFIHYVAPAVWAWKAKKAKKTAALYDHLLVLFPFEPTYFEKWGLQTTFIGHPLVELGIEEISGQIFRDKHNIKNQSTLLCLLPGSRRNEIKRLMDVFRDTVELLSKKHPTLEVVLPTLPHVAEGLQEKTQDWPIKVRVLSGIEEKYQAMRACSVALAASGTVTLELALAGVPMVVAYRMNPLTLWLGRQLVKTPYFSLVNILLGRKAVPEMLQEQCDPVLMAEALDQLLSPEERRENQKRDLKKVSLLLKSGAQKPSKLAAQIVLGGKS